MKLCDLHTHLLPGVDDGALTMEYALQMLRNAAASDVELLAVTPHCNRPCEMCNYLDDSLWDRFLQLQQTAKDIPVRLVLGAEVLADALLPQLLRQKKIPTICGIWHTEIYRSGCATNGIYPSSSMLCSIFWKNPGAASTGNSVSK